MIKKKGAIFDMDGTLLDSMWVWRQIDVDFLGRRGFEVPPDYLEMITPMGYCRAAEYTIERFGLNEKPEDLIQEWYGMAAEAYAKKVELKSHAKEYLLELKKAGAEKIYAYATHTENSVLDREKGTLRKALEDGTVENVFTTNSLYTGKHEKIVVMEVEKHE